MLISVIIPCFNNEGSISPLVERLLKVREDEVFDGHSFEYIFVDDGSTDGTYKALTASKSKLSANCKIVKLTRNFGSYNSFLAGMHYASGQANVYLHADLQDPPELIKSLFIEYQKGNKLVIANRDAREDGGLFSNLYHKMMQLFGSKSIPKGGFDLILFDKEIREKVVKISEKNTNQVYLISWLGYPYVNIPYKREARPFGKSQWSFAKKAQLFIDTILSFTRLAIWAMRISCLAIWGITAWKTYHYFTALEQPNLTFYIMGSFLALMLVIIGEYLERVHESVRNRPNFVVDFVLED